MARIVEGRSYGMSKEQAKALNNPDQTQLSQEDPRHFWKYKKAKEEFNDG